MKGTTPSLGNSKRYSYQHSPHLPTLPNSAPQVGMKTVQRKQQITFICSLMTGEGTNKKHQACVTMLCHIHICFYPFVRREV